MNKKQWNTPSVSNLTLEKTMSGTCPAKAKHVTEENGTCPHFCNICSGCGAGKAVYDQCPYNVTHGSINLCTCLAIS